MGTGSCSTATSAPAATTARRSGGSRAACTTASRTSPPTRPSTRATGWAAPPCQVTATYHRLAARLTAHPVGTIDGTSFRGLTFDRLFSDASLPALAKAWQDLDRGEPIRTDPPEAGFENLLAGRHHVLCADSPWPRKLDAYRTGAAVDRVRYPMLGGSTGSVTPCAFWPRKGIEKPVKISDRGPSNVLMVQNERDPGTPPAGALSLRRALGERARMVSADQGGHGVYPFGSNTCVKDAATAFLTTGERPARDRSCPSATAETS